MLIPDNIHPERTIYFNGAVLLKEIQGTGALDILDLYVHANTIREMSMPLFMLCLDWLYLLNAIEMDEQGKVKLCT